MFGTCVAIRTNKAGDLILDCSLDGWRWSGNPWLGRVSRRLVKLFTWVDSLFQYRVIVSSAMGLGVGVSLIWLIYSQPMTITAQPESYQLQSQLTADHHNYRAVRFGSHAPWLFTTTDDSPLQLPLSAMTYIEDQLLGSSVELLGDNNGIYQYYVVEIRHVATSAVGSLNAELAGQVLLYTPTSILHTKQLVLVLR